MVSTSSTGAGPSSTGAGPSALDLLSGDAQAFREKVWASHVHLHHTDPEDLVGLLSLDDVDHLLTEVALRAPALRLAKDGAVLPESRFTRSATMAGRPLTGLVDGRKVLAELDAGATVVLQGLHRYWPPLTELVRRLELELGHPCQANAYLTPPAAQGFARHSDTHDVFVFQTHGRKQWEVVEGDGAEQSVREIVLEPGLCARLEQDEEGQHGIDGQVEVGGRSRSSSTAPRRSRHLWADRRRRATLARWTPASPARPNVTRSTSSRWAVAPASMPVM